MKQRNFNDNKVNRRRIQTLQRRYYHLEARTKEDATLICDRMEQAALRWAIAVLKEVLMEVESESSTQNSN